MCVCQCSDDEFSVCVSVYLSCMSYDVFFSCINFITAPTLEFSPCLVKIRYKEESYERIFIEYFISDKV